jgi:nucleoside 2-deoxyribosyltransferase
MWFDEQLKDAYENGLKSAIEDAGYDPIRVDMAQFNERIDDRIIAEIRRSRFLVADVTGRRPAVYFEAGFAMGLGLPIIFTCRKGHLDECSFDTRQYPHIEWESPDDLREKLKNRIEATIV